MGKRSNGEGSVLKRKDGKWCAAYTLDAKTRKEVVRKLREALANTYDASYYPDIKIEYYLGKRLKDSVRTRTYERYESVSRVHIIPELGHRTLTSLTEMDVQSLYRRKLDAGCSPRTVQ
jgi:integrase